MDSSDSPLVWHLADLLAASMAAEPFLIYTLADHVFTSISGGSNPTPTGQQHNPTVGRLAFLARLNQAKLFLNRDLINITLKLTLSMQILKVVIVVDP